MKKFNMDPEKLFRTLVDGAVYIHLNEIVTVVARSGFGPKDIEAHMNHLMCDEEYIKRLAFLTRISGSSNWDENGYQTILQQVRQHQPVTVEQWQQATTATTLLVANQQYFTIASIALLVAASLDGDFLEAIREQVKNFTEKNYIYYYLLNQTPLANIDEVLKFGCVYYILGVKLFCEAFGGQITYGHVNNALVRIDSCVRQYLL